MNRPTLRVRYWLGYLTFLLSVIVFADYLFYLHFRTTYVSPFMPVPKGYPTGSLIGDPNLGTSPVETIDPLTASRLGSLMTDRASSFVHFDPFKEEGTVRIGCFGDSFTYGDEVSDGLDYPALLQRMFMEEGFPHMEVLNFGSSDYGVHQTFILWSSVGRKYDMDHVFLGPQGFYPVRDTTFNHTKHKGGWRNIYNMHARYILKDDGVELIDVLGDTIEEKARKYFRFVPYLRYLRYDRHEPPFLACLIPMGRELIVNPFYYTRQYYHDEAYATYERLLKTMAETDTSVLMGMYNPAAVELGRRIEGENFRADLFVAPTHFPYVAYWDHNSPTGNRLLARQFFNRLTNREDTGLTLLRTAPLDRRASDPMDLEKVPLSEYQRVSIEIDGVRIGSLMPMNPLTTDHDLDRLSMVRRHEVVSLFALGDDATSPLDTHFLPLDFELHDGMPLTVRFNRGGDEREISLGTITLLNPGLNLGFGNLDGIFYSKGDLRKGQRMIVSNAGKALESLRPYRDGDSLRILLGNEPVLEGHVEEILSEGVESSVVELQPVGHDFMIIRATVDGVLDVEHLHDAGGVVELTLETTVGRVFRVPFARWFKTVEAVRGTGRTSGPR